MLALYSIALFFSAFLFVNGQLFSPSAPEPAPSGVGLSIAEVVCSRDDLSTLCDVIDSLPPREPIAQELNDPSYPATLFAPTNDAFSQDGSKIIENLRLGSLEDLERTPAAAVRLISNHIVVGVLQQPQLTNGLEIRSVGGETLKISTGYLYGKFIASPGANAGFAGGQGDIPSNRGIIHVIDRVLVPQV